MNNTDIRKMNVLKMSENERQALAKAILLDEINANLYDSYEVRSNGKQYLFKCFKKGQHKASYVIVITRSEVRSILKVRNRKRRYSISINGQPGTNTKLVSWFPNVR